MIGPLLWLAHAVWVEREITLRAAIAPLLRRALGALPADQRSALDLRVVQQLDYEEVAGRLG